MLGGLDLALVRLRSLAGSAGAALIGFIQAGLGAIRRSLQDKLRESVSVADFGASLSATDAVNGAAIAAAITSVSSRGGEVIVPFALSGMSYSVSIALAAGVTLKGMGPQKRWYGSKTATKLNYTGGSSAVTGVGPALSSLQDVGIKNLHFDGTNALANTSGLYLNASDATSSINGIYTSGCSFTNFPKYQVWHNGTVYDVTHHRLTAHNADVAADDCVRIENGVPSQITFDDCFILPYTAGKWGINAVTAGTYRVIGGTVAPQAGGAGANGIYVTGNLHLFGTSVEGVAGHTGTIGIQYLGSTGAFIAPAACTGFGANIKIGDGTAAQARGWVIAGGAGGYNAGGKGDLWITSGGNRIGTVLSLGFSNGDPTITDEARSIDGSYYVNYLHNLAVEAPRIGGSVSRSTVVNRRFNTAYGVSVAIPANEANHFDINVTNGVAFVVANPTGGLAGEQISIKISNLSGGVMGALTWGADFKLAAFTSPANNFSRTIEFEYNGTYWTEKAKTAADVPV